MNISADYENLYLVPEFVSEADLKNISYRYLTATYDYMINTLDSKHYPDRGTILCLSAGTSKLLSATVKTESADTDLYQEITREFAFDRFLHFIGKF